MIEFDARIWVRSRGCRQPQDTSAAAVAASRQQNTYRIDFRTNLRDLVRVAQPSCSTLSGSPMKHRFMGSPPPASLPGGHSVGVPPDPIPNSAVKPDCANGTIAQAMEE